MCCCAFFFFFFFHDPATTEIYTLSLHDALPISARREDGVVQRAGRRLREPAHRFVERVVAKALDRPGGELREQRAQARSEEHTSELQSLAYLVCRLLLEKKKKKERN